MSDVVTLKRKTVQKTVNLFSSSCPETLKLDGSVLNAPLKLDVLFILQQAQQAAMNGVSSYDPRSAGFPHWVLRVASTDAFLMHKIFGHLMSKLIPNHQTTITLNSNEKLLAFIGTVVRFKYHICVRSILCTPINSAHL